MRHIGIDLAWGERARTGLAVLDDRGGLLASGTVVADADIDAFIAEHTDGEPVVAAIDAPIIVRNAFGQRPCEREVGRRFARYHASPHTSNLSRPYFSPETRAMRLVRRWEWDTDPAASDSCRTGFAMEVYPHAAMVSLFFLDKVLPYKAKHRRTLEQRQLAFARLLALMEERLLLGLAGNARWDQIREAVLASTRQVELNAVEDEIDAILCAHLAWLWTNERQRMMVLGDAHNGCIITPSLGERGPQS